jgi:hypothetical protein
MHVPAGADQERGGALGQAAVDHRQQDLLPLRLQLEGDLAAAVPGEAEPDQSTDSLNHGAQAYARRIDLAPGLRQKGRSPHGRPPVGRFAFRSGRFWRFPP